MKSKAAADLFPDPKMEPVLESGWLGASSVLTVAAAPPNKEVELVAEPPKMELLDEAPVPNAKVGLLLGAASLVNGAKMLLVDWGFSAVLESAGLLNIEADGVEDPNTEAP